MSDDHSHRCVLLAKHLMELASLAMQMSLGSQDAAHMLAASCIQTRRSGFTLTVGCDDLITEMIDLNPDDSAA